MIYKAFGLKIKSCVKIPELLPETDDPEIFITYGNVPDSLDDTLVKEAIFEACKDRFLLKVDEVAKYLVENGQRITIETADFKEDTLNSMRLFLLGSVFAALLYQRGGLTLHSSAICHRGKAYMFMGQSGAGKSTTVAKLKERGYSILSDDVALVTIKDDRVILVPGFPGIMLWQDALEKLDIDPQSTARPRAAIDKYRIRLDEAFCSTPLEVEKVFVLNAHNKDRVEVSPVEGSSKLSAVLDNTYRNNFVKGLAQESSHFLGCTALANQAKFVRITRPQDKDTLKEVTSLIEEEINYG